MAVVNNLALVAFCEAVATELLLAQVLVRRGEPGFELRHVSDRAAPSESLKLVQLHDLRALANHTAAGEFRPIKAAPNLRPGWRCLAKSDSELAAALEQLYPGAVADWFALRQPEPPVTHYRDFTARQSGMYRITAMLTDPQAAQVTRACCDERFCLKHRCWTVPGLAPDSPNGKSLIPCLEPCAVMLEFARKAVRIEQEEQKPTLSLAPSELATLMAAIDTTLAQPSAAHRDADFSAPDNHRRLQLLREKLQVLVPVAAAGDGE